MIRITVTPECQHHKPDGSIDYFDSGNPVVGSHLIVNPRYGVFVDGELILRRDRRMKVNRIADHPWIEPFELNPTGWRAWTSFRVQIEEVPR